MKISLSPEQEEIIQHRMATGGYASAEEVVSEALRLLQDQDQEGWISIARLKAEVAEGLADLDAGRYIDVDDAGLGALMEDVKRRGRERLAEERRTH